MNKFFSRVLEQVWFDIRFALPLSVLAVAVGKYFEILQNPFYFCTACILVGLILAILHVKLKVGQK